MYTLYKLNVLLYCLEVNEDEVIGLSGSVQCLPVETEIMLVAGANLALTPPFQSGMAMQTPFESSDVPCVGRWWLSSTDLERTKNFNLAARFAMKQGVQQS